MTENKIETHLNADITKMEEKPILAGCDGCSGTKGCAGCGVTDPTKPPKWGVLPGIAAAISLVAMLAVSVWIQKLF